MIGAANPWLPPKPQDEHVPSATPLERAATGPTGPQGGVPSPDRVDQLPLARVSRSASLWVLGAHGGAAARSVASLLDEWVSADHAWPVSVEVQPSRVVVDSKDQFPRPDRCAVRRPANGQTGLVPVWNYWDSSLSRMHLGGCRSHYATL